jgi:hypothetical protein
MGRTNKYCEIIQGIITAGLKGRETIPTQKYERNAKSKRNEGNNGHSPYLCYHVFPYLGEFPVTAHIGVLCVKGGNRCELEDISGKISHKNISSMRVHTIFT